MTTEALKATLFNNITKINTAFLDLADTLLVPFEEGKPSDRDYQVLEDMRVELHRVHLCIAALRKYTAQIGAPVPHDRYFNFSDGGECTEVSREEYSGSLVDDDEDLEGD